MDEVVEGVSELGIRGRVGIWVEGRAFVPSKNQAKLSSDAIRRLEDEVSRYPTNGDPDWFLNEYGKRPIEHLAHFGALGKNVCLTHVAHIDEQDLNARAQHAGELVIRRS